MTNFSKIDDGSGNSIDKSRLEFDIEAVPVAVWTGLLGVIAALAMGLRFFSLNHHDNAWLLYAVGEYLAGAEFYVDLVEVNPPLIFFLYLPPVWLAKQLSLGLNGVFYSYIFVFAALSCGLSYLIARRFRQINPLVVILMMVVALLVLPRGNFGQREHLMVIFGLPYIFLTLTRLEQKPANRPFATAIGLLAVLGFGLKPYFLAVPLCMEIYLICASRSLKLTFRPETFALGGGLVAYVGLIFFVTPEYLTQIVPTALEVYGQAFNSPFLHVIFRVGLLLMILLVVAGGLMKRDGYALPNPITGLFIAGSGAFATYVLQMKGWSYHSYPPLAFLTVCSGLLIAEWSKGKSSRITRLTIIFLSSIVLFGLPVSFFVDGRYINVRVDLWREAAAKNGSLSAFYAMSSSLSAGFPFVTANGHIWASRFPTLWMLPGIIQRRQSAAGQSQPKLDRIENYVTNAVIEDLKKFKPEFIVVDVRHDKPHYGGIPFEYIDYFSKDQRFKTLWSKYKKTGQSSLGFEYYALTK